MVGDAAGSDLATGVGYRAVFDVLPRAVVVTDPAGRILLWNEPAERLYGWTEVEVLGRSVIEVLAPADDLRDNSEALSMVASGTRLTGDRTVMHRSGQPIRVLTFTQPLVGPSGEVVALVGASEDVTELRRGEQRARDLTEHFGLALEAGGLGTWRWDMASGVTLWDERLEALFGLPPGGFDGRFETYVSLLHPDDREKVLATVRDAVSSESNYRVEHRVVWSDGSVHWIAGAGGVTHDEHGAVTGTVGCSSDVSERVAHELERQRLTAVAMEAADNERLQRERLEFLNTINDALNASSNVHDVMVNVTAAAVPRLGDWCSIHLLPNKGDAVPETVTAHVDPEMVAYASSLQERFPYDPDAPTGVPHVIRTAQTEFYPDITDEVMTRLEATDEERDIIAELALRSAITVPLIKRGRVLGAFQFVMSSSRRRYTEDDVALAQAVAGRIAASIENHRLNDQQRVIAKTLQRSLLPASIPDIAGIEVAVRYWPSGEATEVGGDFYDVFALGPDRQWAIVIGDVCGTGPSAAALTGLARHSIRESAWHGDDHVGVLSSLNRAVRLSGTGPFLTAVYATVDTSKTHPELTVACGGHPLPIHATAHGAQTIGAAGTLLGVLHDVRFHPTTISLDVGDVVVFYTDGATDVRPPHCLDESQFTTLIEQAVAAGGTTESIADRIHAALDDVLSFNLRNDDIALLVLRVTGQ